MSNALTISNPLAFAVSSTISPTSSLHLECGGRISFRLPDGTEVLRFDPDGTAHVRGEKVDSNPAAYQGFCRWLERSGLRTPSSEADAPVIVRA